MVEAVYFSCVRFMQKEPNFNLANYYSARFGGQVNSQGR